MRLSRDYVREKLEPIKRLSKGYFSIYLKKLLHIMLCIYVYQISSSTSIVLLQNEKESRKQVFMK